jgi:hypothetical protein
VPGHNPHPTRHHDTTVAAGVFARHPVGWRLLPQGRKNV